MNEHFDLLNEIKQEWKVDSVLGNDLGEESLKVSYLHSKYYDYYIRLFILKAQHKTELDKLTLNKFHYYLGSADDYKVYSEKPLGRTIVKSDVNLYLNADEELSIKRNQVEYLTFIIDYVKDIIKQIHNRSFQIKNYIEFQK